ncbi:hypothetical protein [Gemmatimonas sp.]|uniref:hypothetical protein n=1 Tax=Gemmatimonas sp. TaxID=1962908 RepID=UPI00286BAE81|nr:hypothetical protein [Gemmatimonas sp.]
MFLPELLVGGLTTTRVNPTGTASRLRLLSCRLERGPVATSRVSVEFEGPAESQRIVSRQEGSACPGGDLRLAALATLHAITQATGGALTFELIGVKPVRAFDTTVMMVAVFAQHGGDVTRIVGAAIVEDDQLVATARAALHAANRLSSPLFE